VQFIIIITILKKRDKSIAALQESEVTICTVEETISIAEEDAQQKKQIAEAQAHENPGVEITEELAADSDPLEPQEILPDIAQEKSAIIEDIADTKPMAEPEPQKPLSPFENAKILVCEDHEQNREVIGGMFRELGIEPQFAVNGAECIDVLDSGKMFDIIFMDLHMPVMDGYEAARGIRSNRKFDSVPIISMPSNMIKEVVNKCFETGMNDRIAKPVEFDRLEYMLAKWLPEERKLSM